MPVASGPAQPITDEPVAALDALRTILSVKLKKPIDAIAPNATIKELSGGKSALQNEVLGDLGAEFGSEPEGAGEKPLSELATLMGGSYTKLGTFTSTTIRNMLRSKMPGGFGQSQIVAYLSEKYGLGPGRQDSVLLQTLLQEPKTRFGSEGEAKAW
jgi:fatty acid synthase subunit alpha